MLVDIHRVLRPDGMLVILIPNRHMTFDQYRSPTPLSHLIDEYRRDIREVDDAHILDFLVHTGETRNEPPRRWFGEEEIRLHRQRSVHVHVWNVDEFGQVMAYASDELGLRWNVIDTMPPGAEGTYGDEFGWVLAKIDNASNFQSRRQRLPRRSRGRAV